MLPHLPRPHLRSSLTYPCVSDIVFLSFQLRSHIGHLDHHLTNTLNSLVPCLLFHSPGKILALGKHHNSFPVTISVYWVLLEKSNSQMCRAVTINSWSLWVLNTAAQFRYLWLLNLLLRDCGQSLSLASNLLINNDSYHGTPSLLLHGNNYDSLDHKHEINQILGVFFFWPLLTMPILLSLLSHAYGSHPH